MRLMRPWTVQAATPAAGLRLENLPKSWLHQFITSLPPQDRLSLFQTCTWLAMEVVLNSTSTTMQLQTHPEWQYSNWLMRAWVTDPFMNGIHCLILVLGPIVMGIVYLVPGFVMSQNIKLTVIFTVFLLAYIWWLPSAYLSIMKFISPKRWRFLTGRIEGIINTSCKIRLISRGDDKRAASLILPCQLSHQVTALEVLDCRHKAFHLDFPLQAFNSLKTLKIHSFLQDEDMQHLTEALSAGHLQQLRSLKLDPSGSEHAPISHDLTLWLSDTVMIRFTEAAVHVLGPRLTHLATTCTQLWDKLQYFTALQSVELGNATPPSSPLGYSVEITAHVARQLCEHPVLRSVTLRGCRLDDTWTHPIPKACGFRTLILDVTRPSVMAAVIVSGLQEVRFENGLTKCAISDMQQLERLIKRPGPAITCMTDSFSVHGGLSVVAVSLITHFTRLRILRLLGHQTQLPLWHPELWVKLPASICGLSMYGPVALQNLIALLRAVPATVHTLCLTPYTRQEAGQWTSARLHTVVPEHVKLTVHPPLLDF